MNHWAIVSDIANQLDSVKLHKEANILDSVLERQAQLLAFKEKPFIAQLAQIMLVLKKYGAGDIVREDLTFPVSGLRLSGMTRQQAVEEVIKHLKTFAEQFLVPNFEKRYRGTKYERDYHQFINEVYILAQMLKGVFTSRTEQQAAREALTAVEQVKKVIGRLIVYERTQEQVQTQTQPGEQAESEELLMGALKILSDLGLAIQRGDTEEILRNIEGFQEIFPRGLSSESAIFKIVADAFSKGALPFVRPKEIDERIEDKMDDSQQTELQRAKSQSSDLKKEIESKYDLFHRLDILEERFNQLKVEIEKREFSAQRTENYDEYMKRIKVVPGIYIVPKSYEHYRNKYRRYEAVVNDISALEGYLGKYNEHPEYEGVVPFSDFLTKGSTEGRTAAKRASEITKINLADLKREVQLDIDTAEHAWTKINSESLIPLQIERQKLYNEIVWKLWHEQFVIKLVETLRYVMSPETRGEETTVQAFNRVLSEFNRLLNYQL